MTIYYWLYGSHILLLILLSTLYLLKVPFKIILPNITVSAFFSPIKFQLLDFLSPFSPPIPIILSPSLTPLISIKAIGFYLSLLLFPSFLLITSYGIEFYILQAIFCNFLLQAIYWQAVSLCTFNDQYQTQSCQLHKVLFFSDSRTGTRVDLCLLIAYLFLRTCCRAVVE